MRKLLFRRGKKKKGKSDKTITLSVLKLWLWSSLPIYGSISLYINTYLSEICCKFTLWSDPIYCLSFQALSSAVYAAINILVSIELTFSSSKLLDFSLGVGPWQPLMYVIYVGVPADSKAHSLNTEFMYFTWLKTKHRGPEAGDKKKQIAAWGTLGGS